MRKTLLNIVAAGFLFAPVPALSQYDDAWPQRHISYATFPSQVPGIPIEPLHVAIAVVLAIIVVVIMAASSKEQQPPPSPEEYDQEAARTRACSRKLDADAMLADSQLRASLKQDELQEFQAFMREKNSRRRK